ncbi:MAG: cytochrome c [Acidobacteria bacterium]|nr:cytochrome c [Acidobacteriota bacterium]
MHLPPRWLQFAIAVLVALSFVPLVVAYRYSTVKKPRPRIHLVPDMDNQRAYQPQQSSALFADGRAMRPPVPGTVAQGHLEDDDAFFRGRNADGTFIDHFPLTVDLPLVERGRDRFNIYCAPCHGYSGFGNGMIAVRADKLQEGTWVPPSSFHDQLVLGRPHGHIYNTISNGIRNMAGYGSQISVRDRWGDVAYVRALQRKPRGRGRRRA